METVKVKMKRRTLLKALIRELELIEERKDIHSLANIVSIKKTLVGLEEERVINLGEACELEVLLLGLLNLLREKEE